ncbi:MAG: HAD-IIA family hydrolase [Acidimicrobiia bacterium]|nr:HAD-IIA family hydrolase [Acidimicrobiia bacterium]
MTSDSSLPVVCCDLDGVVWRGEEPVPGAADGVARLRGAGIRVGFVTNNSSATTADVVARLARSGVPAGPDDVITSAHAAAALLAASHPAGSTVLACSGPGVEEALAARGFRVVAEGPADAVVVGWHRTFDFERLHRASAAVRDGARFVATNLDATYPVAGGLLPGNGALVAAVATAAGRRPEVAGKPEAAMVALVHERLGARGVVVGDRPSTDGALAAALGWPFALVLSGVTSGDGEAGGERVPDPPPRWVAADLGELADSLRTELRVERSA